IMKHTHVRIASLLLVVVTVISFWKIQRTTTLEERHSKIPENGISTTNIDVKKKVQAAKPKLILYWGLAFGDERGRETSTGECEVTYDRNRLKEARIVAFHKTTISAKDIPWTHYRIKSLIHLDLYTFNFFIIFLTYNNLFDNFFNWTWTYKRSSNALRGYGTREGVLASVKRGKLVVDEIMWTVSHCGGSQGAIQRMQYYKDLVQAGLTVSTFGGCFSNSEKITWSFPTNYPDKLRKHKFYLAFENSIRCKDYITEKFWDNALKNDMVPIVWGPAKEDVLAVAPLDSFIHCDDFESPAKLVEYLHFLDQHDDEYRKYFHWREDESMTGDQMAKLTKEKYPEIDVMMKPKDLCNEYLKNTKTKIIKSLNQEFIASDREECFS
uniref:Fucosyltransferase n=1 Tax=Ciona savignyi TaxID=51511 RepID=H2Z661_CIOSA